jgi:hypothetical protein
VSPGESSPGARAVPVPYRRLPGDFRGFFRRNTLWLGSDHLLLVDSTRFSETYKRFYLRDIQTIIVRKTPRFVLPYYWVLLAGVALIVLLIGLGQARQVRVGLFWLAVATLAGVSLYLYIASMFQSCTCHLVTRVNNVELTSLFRLRAARQFVEVMAPGIVAAQGQLPADWLERSTSLEELSTAADRNPDAPVDLLPPGQFSFITVVVFLLVLADAALAWLQLRTNDSISLSVPNTLNMIALAICATIAIVRMSRQSGGRGLRMLVLAGLFVVAGVTYGGVLVQSFDRQFFRETSTNPLLYHGMRQLVMAEIVADIAVAIPGLILAFRQKQSPQKPAISFADLGTPTGEPKP